MTRPTRAKRGRGRGRHNLLADLFTQDRLTGLGGRALRISVLLALPFVLLIRGAVLSQHPGNPGCISIVIGAALSIWKTWLWHRLTTDVRTRYRSGLRNNLAQIYFEIIEFDTLRHSGSRDHLHVSLPRS